MINRTLNREPPAWYVCQLTIVNREQPGLLSPPRAPPAVHRASSPVSRACLSCSWAFPRDAAGARRERELDDVIWARIEPVLPPLKGAMGRPMGRRRARRRADLVSWAGTCSSR